MFITEYPWRTTAAVVGLGACIGFGSGVLVWDKTANKPLYNPYRAQELTYNMRAKAEGIAGSVGKTSVEPVVTKPLADQSVIAEVASKLKASPVAVHCPSTKQPEYRVPFTEEENDPNALLCLRTSDLKVASNGSDGSTIVMSMSVSPEYGLNNKANFIPNSLGGLTPEQCRAVTDKLESYGGYLAVTDGGLSPDLAVPIAVVAVHDTRNKCDTWPLQVRSEKADR